MEPLQIESSQPGTLLWIGPTAHDEFADAYRYCRNHVAQIAVRKSLREALLRPAGYVRRVIFARPTRQTPRRAVWDRFIARYDQASSLALCSSLCDGEARTGTPWPADGSIRFSRWGECLPGWLSPCGARDKRVQQPSSLLVISDRFEMAEPYLQWASGIQLTAHWQRRFIPALHGGFDTVLWDDSAACPADARTWQLRLGERSDPPAALSPKGAAALGPSSSADKPQPRHLWIALHPSIDAIHQAHGGGIASVLTKPVRIDSIFSIFL